MYPREKRKKYGSDRLKNRLVERKYNITFFGYSSIKAELEVDGDKDAVKFTATAIPLASRMRGCYLLRWEGDDIYKKIIDREYDRF